MFRFLVFAWTRQDEDRSETVRQLVTWIATGEGAVWSSAVRGKGLEVWQSGARSGGMEALCLPDGGVVLGRTLSRSEGFPDWTACSLADVTSSFDPTKQAQWLVKNIWGSYVAFLPRREGFPLAVIRDPSGGLPCYRVKWRDIDIFTSDIEVLRNVPELHFSVDLDSFSTSVMLPFVCKARTCLAEVSAVLPGECLCISNERERRIFLWDPVSLSQLGGSLTTEEAGAAMRDTLRHVVGALARPYRHILHSLGGLDSSILLSCLKGAPSQPEVTCVNYFTNSFSGDERWYAEKMSSHVGVPLVERRLLRERVDLDNWRLGKMGPAPPAMFDCAALAAGTHELVLELEVDSLCSGVGGDSILFEAPHIFPALDYVLNGRISSDIFRIALESAQLGGRSLAFTARKMLLEKLKPSSCFRETMALLHPGHAVYYINPNWIADSASPSHLHPMLKVDDHFPKGKYYHIVGSSFLNLEGLRYRLPSGSVSDHLWPLMAQPFVELCLQIPTWQLSDGGIGRGLARRAFWNDLPREIVGRVSKCTDQGIYEEIFMHNLPFLREMLLDGVLSKLGLFNRVLLEEALFEQRDLTAAKDPATFLDLYAWEVWASRWSG